MNKKREEVKEFWDDRASLKEMAGTNDFILKEIEMRAIYDSIANGNDVLEIGCGSGGTAIHIAKNKKVSILAVDYSEKMIKAAKKERNLAGDLLGSVEFEVHDVSTIEKIMQNFDIVFTERVLINLGSWDEQKNAIEKIIDKVRPGGYYIMCENSIEGLQRINAYRVSCGLEEITPPWHNCYFSERDLEFINLKDAKLVRVDHISSSYYFLSRVVNAWLAKESREDPRYDAKVNELGLLLPQLGELGQTKIWIFQKKSII